MSVAGEVKQFLIEKEYMTAVDQVNDEESLLENGVIDSIVILELVNFLEEKYGMEIDEEELMPENFDSLKAIEEYVESQNA